jgi:hypothetical protein
MRLKVKVKLMVKVKIKFAQKQTMKAQRGNKGIAYSFFNLGARLGWVVNATPRPIDPRERPSTHCIGGWVGPRAGLDGYEKYRPHGNSIPRPSALSQSLYRLSHPDPHCHAVFTQKTERDKEKKNLSNFQEWSQNTERHGTVTHKMNTEVFGRQKKSHLKFTHLQQGDVVIIHV